MRRSTALALVTMILGVGLTGLVAPGPAAAATKAFEDRRGDAPPRHDMLRLRIGNNPDGVTLRVKVRDLRGGKRTQVVELGLVMSAATLVARSVRRGNGNVVTRIILNDGGDGQPVRCPKSSRWLLRRDVVSMRFDQDCLGADRGRLGARVVIGWGPNLWANPPLGPADWSRAVVVRYD
jgi:hypothetical protein